MSNLIPILMYHSIDDNSKNSVKIESFTKQMTLMKKLGYKSINLCELEEYKNCNKKVFVVTFDDGYESIYKNALPILKKFNFNGTCFIVYNSIDKYNTWDKNINNFKKMKIMNEDQINQWIKCGNEIGSHTLDHYDLLKLNENDSTDQIAKSRKKINTKFNITIKSFSYPYGHFNFKIKKIVKQFYKFSVTTKRSRYKINKFSDFEIPRIPINNNTNLVKFFLKIKTFYEDIKFTN